MVERIRRADLGKETTPECKKDGKGAKECTETVEEGRSGARRTRCRVDDDGKTSPRTSEREKSFAQNSFWKTEARNCQRAKEIVEKFWLAGNGKRGADARLNRKRGAPCRLSETLLLSVKEIQNANFAVSTFYTPVYCNAAGLK